MKGAAWQLEKLYRRLFGDDVPSPGAGIVEININLGSPPIVTQDAVTQDALSPP